jgi:HSP20 family protein
MATTTERNVEGRTQESEQRNAQGGAGTQGENQQALRGSQQRPGAEQGSDVAVRQGQGGNLQARGQGGVSRYGRDPFEMMQRISDEMDQLFDSFFYGRPIQRQARHQGLQSLWAPEVELCEEGNQLRVCVDLPGVAKDNVKIDIHEGMLTIQGERREERTEGGEGQGFRRSERRYGSFYRTIPLPEGVEAENAQARMKDGVLEISIPVTPAKQPRRLEIQS